MKKFLLAFMLTILFIACGSQKAFFTLDNPTDEKISIIIDGKNHDLEAHSHEKFELSSGEHIIENDKYKVTFTVYADSKGGIINPTGSPYIRESRVYAIEGHENSGAPMEIEFYIDNFSFYGPFTVTYDFIIDRSYGHSASGNGDWDYDIFEAFPDEVTFYDKNMKVNIFKKMYNKNEFLDMLAEFNPDLKAEYDREKQIEKIEPTFRTEEDTYSKNMAIAQSIKDENTRKYAIEIVELDKQYAEAKDAKTQEKLTKEYKKAWKEYVDASMKLSQEQRAAMEYITPTNFGKGLIINSIEVK